MKTSSRIQLITAMALSAIFLFSLESSAQTQPPRDQKSPPNFAQLLEEMDTNKDGKLSLKEVKGPLKKDFSKIDLNSDGFITKEEFDEAPKPERGQRPERN